VAIATPWLLEHARRVHNVACTTMKKVFVAHKKSGGQLYESVMTIDSRLSSAYVRFEVL
jgi:hypothetical protein